MKLGTALRLGRVSNLPTVGTNAITGAVLAGGALGFGPAALLVLAAGLAYTAGMFLNDAFDAEIDARDQPFRPIPSGLVARSTVYAWGFGMLGLGVALIAATGLWSGNGWGSAVLAVALAGVVLAYNRDHKENAFGPVLMGLCRVFVYLAAGAAAAAALPPALWLGAALLMGHVMGLTFVAKREGTGRVGRVWPFVCLAAPLAYGLAASVATPLTMAFVIALAIADGVALRLCLSGRPADIGRAIPMLIAAICLLDATLIASHGQPWLALAAAGFPLTLMLQRWVRGT